MFDERDSKHSAPTIFIPVYNEEKGIKFIVKEWIAQTLRDQSLNMVILDDGSEDNTLNILTELSRLFSKNLSVFTQTHKGFFSAIKKGMRIVNSEYMFISDGDGQYDPRDASKLMSYISRCDLVLGKKTNRVDPAYRIVFSKLFNRFVKTLFKVPYSDMNCGFRVFNKRVKNLTLKYLEYSPLTEQVIRSHYQGYIIIEVPINHRPRLYGKTKLFKPLNFFTILFSQLFGVLQLYNELSKLASKET